MAVRNGFISSSYVAKDNVTVLQTTTECTTNENKELTI